MNNHNKYQPDSPNQIPPSPEVVLEELRRRNAGSHIDQHSIGESRLKPRTLAAAASVIALAIGVMGAGGPRESVRGLKSLPGHAKVAILGEGGPRSSVTELTPEEAEREKALKLIDMYQNNSG